MGKTNTYAVAIHLSEAEAGAIEAQGSLGTIANGLLRDLARGGVMIPPEWAARIESAIQGVDPSLIVHHVEKSVGRQGEAERVEWIPDPTQISFYRHLAENNGLTLERQLKTLMDHAYAQGWFGMAAPEADKILLSGEQYRYLQEMFGKDVVTGQDVIERLHDTNPGMSLAESDDLVLDSLKD